MATIPTAPLFARDIKAFGSGRIERDAIQTVLLHIRGSVTVIYAYIGSVTKYIGSVTVTLLVQNIK